MGRFFGAWSISPYPVLTLTLSHSSMLCKLQEYLWATHESIHPAINQSNQRTCVQESTRQARMANVQTKPAFRPKRQFSDQTVCLNNKQMCILLILKLTLMDMETSGAEAVLAGNDGERFWPETLDFSKVVRCRGQRPTPLLQIPTFFGVFRVDVKPWPNANAYAAEDDNPHKKRTHLLRKITTRLPWKTRLSKLRHRRGGYCVFCCCGLRRARS